MNAVAAGPSSVYLYPYTTPCVAHQSSTHTNQSTHTRKIKTDGKPLPEIKVLKGGFEGWVALYGGEDGMVEPVDVAR